MNTPTPDAVGPPLGAPVLQPPRRERPILFSAPMVRAILAGTKTQTRRALAPDLFISSGGAVVRMASVGPATTGIHEAHCPYWRQPGDALWVRETFMDLGACFLYRADAAAESERAIVAPGQPWRPAIYMPRVASRITLEVTGLSVEQLQDISEANALAEGIVETCGGFGLPDGSHFHAADPRESYWSLWEAINGPGSVERNPPVWVVEFRKRQNV